MSDGRSPRGKKTARLAELPYLLAAKPRSQRDLARYFGVSAKTIKREIVAITPYHNVSEDRDGREVVYRLEDYWYRPPPLTPAEVATLLLAQQSIAATGLTAFGSPFAEHARGLLEKARASLPKFLHEKLDALAAVFGSSAVPAKDFSPHAATIDRLTEAAVRRRRVRMRYYTLNTDTTTERTVEPYAVYFDPDGATLKLVAHDHQRQKLTIFSIDHIRQIQETDERFTRPADFNLREYLAENCFNGIHGEPVTVRLRAHGTTARVFAERIFHRSQRTLDQTARTAHCEETITIEMRVARGRGLVRFILSWGADVEVLDPPEVRQEVAEAYRRALARHADE